ncbi:MAG: hypothetical protein JNL99_07770 [Zoogloea sp.]|nr:hypothetical protein [Zoogloea sp.]
MGLWDSLCENILAPAASLVFDGVEAIGSSIDKAVTTGIDVVGGGLDSAIERVKENPVESAAIAGALLTGGLGGGLGGAAARTLAGTVGAAATKSTGIPAAKIFGGALIAGTTTSQAMRLIDKHLRDKVKPRVGSVVYCDLAVFAEHSGIYVGKGRIAHLDGSGRIEIVTARQFLKRLGGLNPADSIYVSCDDEGAIKASKVAKRAREMEGGERPYNVILDNCHQFTSGCLTGDFENADNFLWMLKHTAEQKLGATTWRLWDLTD